ncbi:hypothetical protein BASA81_014898 [Batrachochytrium salamandrivorans]|nr:hypothetical protein BASA81_014898 [Batrachochytrium salamandrivorans]
MRPATTQHIHCYLVVECEQVTGHRIQSRLAPAIQKSRLRLLGRAFDPGVENVYTWLRGGVLNGEAYLDQRWLDGTVEHESMGTRHDNRALAARLADFLQAFDTVPVGALLWKLQNMGFPRRTLAFLKALYTSSSARARAGSLLSDPFPVQRGVRQGCPLSGLLFNLFINDILDGVVPITVPGLSRDTNPIRGLMYADDVAVFADSEQSLLAASAAVEQWANRWKMQFGVAKCGIISFTGHLAPRLDSPLDIRLHGQLVSRVESYKYLGVLIDSKLDHSAWLKQNGLHSSTLSRLFTQCWLTTS